MNYSKECLYDVGWQSLHCRMLGKWGNNYGVKQALEMLEGYWSYRVDDRSERIWRTLNLLNAIKLGWEQSSTMPGDEMVARVCEMYNKMTRLHSRNMTDPDYTLDLRVWNWDKVAEDLRMLSDRTFKEIKANIGRRVKSAERRAAKGGVDVKATREELFYFVALLEIERQRRFSRGPSRCLAKVVMKKSPYMQEFRGYRVLAAAPNMAGTRPFKDEKCPSFDKPYLIVQFGDFETQEALDKALELLPTEMKRRGFEAIEMIE